VIDVYPGQYPSVNEAMIEAQNTSAISGLIVAVHLHAGVHTLDLAPAPIRGGHGLPSRMSIVGDGDASILRPPHAAGDAPMLKIFEDTEVFISDVQLQGQVLVTNGSVTITSVTFSLGPSSRRLVSDPAEPLHGRQLRHAFGGAGGGLRVIGGDVVVNASTWDGVVAANGGAIAIEGGKLTGYDCNFVRNIATSEGGAVYALAGELLLIRATLDGNTAARGGSVAVAAPPPPPPFMAPLPGATVTIADSRISSNTAETGGGVFVAGGKVRVQGTQVRNNHANVNGGGVATTGGDFTLSDATRLSSNTAAGEGRAVYVASGVLRYTLPAPLGTWIAAPIRCIVYYEPCPADQPDCDPALQPELEVQPCPYQDNPELLGTTYAPFSVGPLDDDYPFSCAAGLFGNNETSAQSSATCAGECPAGTYSHSAAFECTPCGYDIQSSPNGRGETMLVYKGGTYCPAGSAGAPGIYGTACPPGSYGNASGLPTADDCLQCPLGHGCEAGSSAPLACASGTYAGRTGQAICYACEPGSFQPDAKAISCADCPTGHYCGMGSANPSSCFAGFFNPEIRQSLVEHCISCQPGTYCDTGSSEETLCPAGTYGRVKEVGTFECNGPCAKGFYCPAGSTIKNATACPAGTYNDQEGQPSVEACRPCPVGAYCLEGSENPIPCTGIDASFTTNGLGARSAAGCVCGVSAFMRSRENTCGMARPRAGFNKALYPVKAIGTEEACLNAFGEARGRCEPCPLGAKCEVPGSELERLPLYGSGETMMTANGMLASPGYWRASGTSLRPRECRPEACVGLSANNTGWRHNCEIGYMGVMCNTCDLNYYDTNGPNGYKICELCQGSAVMMYIAPIVALIALATLLAMWPPVQRALMKPGGLKAMMGKFGGMVSKAQAASNLAGGNGNLAAEFDSLTGGGDAADAKKKKPRKSRVKRLMAFAFRFIRPVLKWYTILNRKLARANSKIKVLLSLFQVVGGMGEGFGITYPAGYTSFLSFSGVLSLDIGFLPLACMFPLNFHTNLVLNTVGPLFIMSMLFSTGKLLMFLSRFSEALEDAAPKAAQSAYTYAFFLLFLIYPGTCKKIFTTFRCLNLGTPDDPGPALDQEDGGKWLMADLSIDCAGPAHKLMELYAFVMILVFPLGTPLMYYYLTNCVYKDTLNRIRDKAAHDVLFSRMKQLGGRLGDTLQLAPDGSKLTLKQSTIRKAKVSLSRQEERVHHARDMVKSMIPRRRARSPSPTGSDAFEEPTKAADPNDAHPDWAKLDDFDEDDIKKIQKIQAACRRRYASSSTAPPSPPPSPPAPSKTGTKTSKASKGKADKGQKGLSRQGSMWSKVGDKTVSQVEQAGKPTDDKKKDKRKKSSASAAANPVALRIAMRNEQAHFNALPKYIQKLVGDYEPGVYWFETFECLRKLAIVGLPTFFSDGQGAEQLVFGLIIVFATACVYVGFRPFKDNSTDILSQMCQIQIFLSLVSAVILQAEALTGESNPVLGYAFMVMAFVPIVYTLITTLCPDLIKPLMDKTDKSVRAQIMAKYPKGPTGEAEAQTGLLTPPMLRAQLDSAVQLSLTDTDAIVHMLKNVRDGKFDFQYYQDMWAKRLQDETEKRKRAKAGLPPVKQAGEGTEQGPAASKPASFMSVIRAAQKGGDAADTDPPRKDGPCSVAVPATPSAPTTTLAAGTPSLASRTSVGESDTSSLPSASTPAPSMRLALQASQSGTSVGNSSDVSSPSVFGDDRSPRTLTRSLSFDATLTKRSLSFTMKNRNQNMRMEFRRQNSKDKLGRRPSKDVGAQQSFKKEGEVQTDQQWELLESKVLMDGMQSAGGGEEDSTASRSRWKRVAGAMRPSFLIGGLKSSRAATTPTALTTTMAPTRTISVTPTRSVGTPVVPASAGSERAAASSALIVASPGSAARVGSAATPAAITDLSTVHGSPLPHARPPQPPHRPQPPPPRWNPQKLTWEERSTTVVTTRSSPPHLRRGASITEADVDVAAGLTDSRPGGADTSRTSNKAALQRALGQRPRLQPPGNEGPTSPAPARPPARPPAPSAHALASRVVASSASTSPRPPRRPDPQRGASRGAGGSSGESIF